MIDFHNNVWPKINSLLCNKFNRNSDLICPKLLPFITNVVQCEDLFSDTAFYNNWVNKFFCDFLLVVKVDNFDAKSNEKDEIIIALKTYIDCLRFFIQRTLNNVSIDMNGINDITDTESSDHLIEGDIDNNLLFRILFRQHLLSLLKWLIYHSSDELAMSGFNQISYIVAFYYKHCTNVPIYSKLLSLIWNSIARYMDDIFNINVSNYPGSQVKRLTQFLKIMHYTILGIKSKNIDENKGLDGGASDGSDDKYINDLSTLQAVKNDKIKEPSENYSYELKSLTHQLLRYCLHNAKQCDRIYCMEHVRTLTDLLGNKIIYAKLTANGTVLDSIDYLLYLLKHKSFVNEKQINILIELIYDVLHSYSSIMRPSMFQKILEVCLLLMFIYNYYMN